MEPSAASPAFTEDFARRFAARAGPTGGRLTFAEFMDLALYDPEVGYYRTNRSRVGRAGGADFYTAASMGGVFGPLVAAAATTLLGGLPAAHCEFVEIGAEPGSCVLDGVNHGFLAVRTIRIGEPVTLDGATVVFSNELFDAQPFHRIQYRDGAWIEHGVQCVDGKPTWTNLPEFSPPVAAAASRLPAHAPNGYVLDLPLAAECLAREIGAAGWHGVFLAFDYGRTWNELISEYPAGTGRGYAQHRQTGDLLANAGGQDLTCHVCWDWLGSTLSNAGFQDIARESQESFFVRRATAEVERIMVAERNPLSPRRTQLKHLLHPALMGQRFEALWGVRPGSWPPNEMRGSAASART